MVQVLSGTCYNLLSEPMLTLFYVTNYHIASRGPNELINKYFKDDKYNMGQVTKVGLTCCLFLLSFDSKTRKQDSAHSWPDPYH